MTPEEENIGITSLLPITFRDRAEVFARNLHSRLRSLSPKENDLTTNDTSWLNEDKPINEPKLYLQFPNHTFSNTFSQEVEQSNGIKVNGLNEAQEAEVCEEVEKVEEFEEKQFETVDLSDITEEILAHALDVVEVNQECYCSTLNIDKGLTIEYGNATEVPKENLDKINSNFVSDDKNSEDDENCDDERIPRVRRCSSLKTGKTPPGTPGQKKIVRFADVLGLDLADVRTFLDEIPKIPNSAYKDLINTEGLNDANLVINKNQRTLLAMFQQPGGQTHFIDKVRIQNIMLENAILEDPIAFSIRGIVRVRNLDFNKTVHVRYSIDSWKTYSDLPATYIENSCDGFSDKFTFLIYAYSLSIGQKLEFAVRFQCKGSQYWDSNGGANYCFQCLPTNPSTYVPITTCMDEKFATFYYMENSKIDEDLNQKGELTRSAVQDYIMNSLQKNDKRKPETEKNTIPEFYTLFLVLFFSILFFYVKKSIIF